SLQDNTERTLIGTTSYKPSMYCNEEKHIFQFCFILTRYEKAPMLPDPEAIRFFSNDDDEVYAGGMSRIASVTASPISTHLGERLICEGECRSVGIFYNRKSR
ncbi:MAG: hypothetical protein AAF639_33050, partial [Chloroflexota bacterium]